MAGDSPRRLDTRPPYQGREVEDDFSLCQSLLCETNACTDFQQILKSEMRKQAKFDHVVHHKMASKARRLLDICHFSCPVKELTWVTDGLRSLAAHVEQQGEVHKLFVNMLSDQCNSVQEGLDAHHYVVNAVHSLVNSPASPGGDHTAKGLNSDPRDEGGDSEYLQACCQFERMRRGRLECINNVDLLRRQQETISKELDLALDNVSRIDTSAADSVSPQWIAKMKRQDFESKVEFLRTSQRQIEHNVRIAQKELADFDKEHDCHIKRVRDIFSKHRNMCQDSLKKSFQLLKAISLQDRSVLSESSGVHGGTASGKVCVCEEMLPTRPERKETVNLEPQETSRNNSSSLENQALGKHQENTGDMGIEIKDYKSISNSQTPPLQTSSKDLSVDLLASSYTSQKQDKYDDSIPEFTDYKREPLGTSGSQTYSTKRTLSCKRPSGTQNSTCSDVETHSVSPLSGQQGPISLRESSHSLLDSDEALEKGILAKYSTLSLDSSKGQELDSSCQCGDFQNTSEEPKFTEDAKTTHKNPLKQMGFTDSELEDTPASDSEERKRNQETSDLADGEEHGETSKEVSKVGRDLGENGNNSKTRLAIEQGISPLKLDNMCSQKSTVETSVPTHTKICTVKPISTSEMPSFSNDNHTYSSMERRIRLTQTRPDHENIISDVSPDSTDTESNMSSTYGYNDYFQRPKKRFDKKLYYKTSCKGNEEEESHHDMSESPSPCQSVLSYNTESWLDRCPFENSKSATKSTKRVHFSDAI